MLGILAMVHLNFNLPRWDRHRLARTVACLALLLGIAGTAWAEPDAETTNASAPQVVEQAKPDVVSVKPEVSIKEAALPPTVPVTQASITSVIQREATRAGLPPEIAEAVTHTESGFNRNAIGADGEIGLMQVLPSTARMMGFRGSLAELAVPETNIRYGVNYLAQAWRLAGRDICTAVMKYRAGHGETRFSHLSVAYCLKVRARLSSRGFAVTGIVPVATFGASAKVGSLGIGGRCRGKCIGGSRGETDLAALNSKLNQIVFRVTVLKVPQMP